MEKISTKRLTFAAICLFVLNAGTAMSQTWQQLSYYYPRTTQSTAKIFVSPGDVLVAGMSYNSAPASHISLDEGVSWQQIFADKPIASVEYGPDGTIYFISTKRYLTTSTYYIDTLFKSSDGITWTNMGYKLKDGENEYEFTISGNNTLLFPNYSDINGTFLSASADNAVSWTNLAMGAGPVASSTTSDTIITSFTSPWPGGIKYSHDGGATVNISSGISAGGTIPVITPNGEIYAAAIGQIYKSTDGGITFNQVTYDYATGSQIYEFLYAANGKFYLRTLTGIWETTDFSTLTHMSATLPDASMIKDIDISDNYLYAVADTNLYRTPLSAGTSADGAETFEKSIAIFPNPAADLVTIQNLPEVSVISIMDLTGKLIYQRQCSGNHLYINTSDFETGVYFVQISCDKHVVNKKLIISK